MAELRKLVGGRVVRPSHAPDVQLHVGPDDDPAMIASAPADSDLESIGGIGCIITYEGADGYVSIRRVTCRKLTQGEATTQLLAYCHEREAVRTFCLDRIHEAACGVTGEVFAPGALFFQRFAVGPIPRPEVSFGLEPNLAGDLRACLNVLAFMGRVDGRLVQREAEVIEGFCSSFGLRFADDSYLHDGACRHASQLAPDADVFFASLHRIKRIGAPEGLGRLLQQSVGRLIDADGSHHDREFEFGVEVQRYLSTGAA